MSVHRRLHSGWTTFPTAIGTCGVAWRERGLTAFCFPEATEARLRAAVAKASGVPQATQPVPAWVRRVAGQVRKHLEGDLQDFRAVPVDLDGVAPFARAVYDCIRQMPPGAVMTYGELASRLGKPGASRAVGTALGKNPVPLIVPCHRIVAASGKLGGFSAPGGIATKLDLLEREGVCLAGALRPRRLTEPSGTGAGRTKR